MSCRVGAALLSLAVLGACLAQPPDPQEQEQVQVPSADADVVDQPADQQLLANPDFEDGASGWQVAGTAMIGDADALGVTMSAASGDSFAQVGRKNNASDGIAQAVTVPDWAETLRLSGKRCFDTDETDTTRDDVVTILLLDSGGATLEPLLSVSNTEVGGVCDWTEFSSPAADAHPGEEVQISIFSTSDGSDVTAFWFDDLRLTASIE